MPKGWTEDSYSKRSKISKAQWDDPVWAAEQKRKIAEGKKRAREGKPRELPKGRRGLIRITVEISSELYIILRDRAEEEDTSIMELVRDSVEDRYEKELENV